MGGEEFFVTLNGARLSIPGSTITGLQLRLIARIPAGHAVIVEGHDLEADHLLADTDVLDTAESAPHLFSKPPTAFGSSIDARP